MGKARAPLRHGFGTWCDRGLRRAIPMVSAVARVARLEADGGRVLSSAQPREGDPSVEGHLHRFADLLMDR
jgi:hypothetical protein